MNNFTIKQQREMADTAVKLARITTHPAHPFLAKTFNEILEQYELLNEFDKNSSTMKAKVFCIQKLYMLNMLTALNLRIDVILSDRKE